MTSHITSPSSPIFLSSCIVIQFFIISGLLHLSRVQIELDSDGSGLFSLQISLKCVLERHVTSLREYQASSEMCLSASLGSQNSKEASQGSVLAEV